MFEYKLCMTLTFQVLLHFFICGKPLEGYPFPHTPGTHKVPLSPSTLRNLRDIWEHAQLPTFISKIESQSSNLLTINTVIEILSHSADKNNNKLNLYKNVHWTTLVHIWKISILLILNTNGMFTYFVSICSFII